jgi:hypothetical protein
MISKVGSRDVLPCKSPIISPDLKSENLRNARSLIMQDLAGKRASFALAFKHGLRPESLDSPRIRAGQQIVSSKEWGILQPFRVA